MTNIAIFSSGSGSNAENIINYFKNDNKVAIKVIISDKSDAFVHNRAKKLGIESITFKKTDFIETNEVLNYLKSMNIDFVVLAGFLLKVPENIINEYPNKIINIHPALLPNYGGKGMYGDNVHKAVIENKETESGITIHHINENYDEGDIIFQAKCSIEPNDSYQDLANKIHQLEHLHFPKIIEQVIHDL